MIERIYIGCCATDVWLARISVASIRYWHPDAPICLLRDHGRGFADTSEIEKYWSVDVLDCTPAFAGCGFTKIELLLRPKQERFLFVDADTAFVGPVLDTLQDRPEQFVISPDFIADPRTHHVIPFYFDYAKLREYDPSYVFPGYVFNTGQFVATSGLLRAEDFAGIVDWKVPPVWLLRDVFSSAEQGFLNYLFARRAQQGALTLGTATLYYDGLSEEAARLEFRPPARDHRFLLHWPGEKSPTAGGYTRGDVLQYFEDLYYSRIPGGAAKRAIRTGQRLARWWRRDLSVKVYQALPRGVRQMVKRLAGR